MPGESYRKRLRSLLLSSCYVFRAKINSLRLLINFHIYVYGGGCGEDCCLCLLLLLLFLQVMSTS